MSDVLLPVIVAVVTAGALAANYKWWATFIDEHNERWFVPWLVMGPILGGAMIVFTLVALWRGTPLQGLPLSGFLSGLALLIGWPIALFFGLPTKAAETHVARNQEAVDLGQAGSSTTLHIQSEQEEQRMDKLRGLVRILPNDQIRKSLPAVTAELTELQRNVAIASEAGVPEAVTERLSHEADVTATALWSRVDRIEAVSRMVKAQPGQADPVILAANGWESFPGLSEGLSREADKMDRLHESIREARAALVQLTLSGGGGRIELQRVETRFRSLAETAREIQEEELG